MLSNAGDEIYEIGRSPISYFVYLCAFPAGMLLSL